MLLHINIGRRIKQFQCLSVHKLVIRKVDKFTKKCNKSIYKSIPDKINIFRIWSSQSRNITPLSPLKFNWLFWGICRIDLQGWRISQARNQKSLLPASHWFLSWLINRPSRRWWYIPPKRQLNFSWLHYSVSENKSLIKCNKGWIFSVKLFNLFHYH